jgi:hypothetical protein
VPPPKRVLITPRQAELKLKAIRAHRSPKKSSGSRPKDKVVVPWSRWFRILECAARNRAQVLCKKAAVYLERKSVISKKAEALYSQRETWAETKPKDA